MPTFENIPLERIMTRQLVTLYLHDCFSQVYEKMKLYKIHHLPVIDKEGRLAGIVTERDLFRAQSPRETEEGWVYDDAELNLLSLTHFMTHNPATLTPQHTLRDALEQIVSFKYGCIPIVSSTQDKKLVGIVSQADILRYLLGVLTG